MFLLTVVQYTDSVFTDSDRIGDAGATQLAHVLERNRTLMNLDIFSKHQAICARLCLSFLFIFFFHFALAENQIGAAGATQLAHALERNSTLTTLDLVSKHQAIFVCLCVNFLFCIIFSLAMIALMMLTDNEIGAVGATQLAHALERNSTLTSLNLYSKHQVVFIFAIVCFCY